MPEYFHEANPRTGIRRSIKDTTPLEQQRRGLGIRRAASPAAYADVSLRSKFHKDENLINMTEIRNAYLAECYIRQAIDKYVEMTLKEGYIIEGQPITTNWLKRRLDRMSLATGTLWEDMIEIIVREFILYGNAFIYVRRAKLSEDENDGSDINSDDGAAALYNTKNPIAAFFPLPAHQMNPVFNDEGRLVSWQRSLEDKGRGVSIAGKQKGELYPARDIIHIAYARPASSLWGIPMLLPVIGDGRALRQIEESILKLVDKNISPLIHIAAPDSMKDGNGRQEDIDEMVDLYQGVAVDGCIVTPPDFTIKVLGVENQAIRAEPYVEMFKKRVFAGLNVSELIMGENKSATMGSADALTAQMHHRIKAIQQSLSRYIEHYFLFPLLFDAGFDPINKDMDKVSWKWHEIEIDRKIKEDTYTTNLFTMNVITQTEARAKMGYAPLTPEQMGDMYVNRVQNDDKTSQGAIDNVLQPQNQHGSKMSPGGKILPNATTAHKLSAPTRILNPSHPLDAIESYLDGISREDRDSLVSRLAGDNAVMREQLLHALVQEDPIMGIALAKKTLEEFSR